MLPSDRCACDSRYHATSSSGRRDAALSRCGRASCHLLCEVSTLPRPTCASGKSGCDVIQLRVQGIFPLPLNFRTYDISRQSHKLHWKYSDLSPVREQILSLLPQGLRAIATHASDPKALGPNVVDTWTSRVLRDDSAVFS